MEYFDLHTFIGKEITPPGGAELVCKFLDQRYFSPRAKRFRYLEVASHTGALSRKVAELNLHEQIIGIDVSPFAVARGNHLCAQANLKNIEFQVQDVRDLDFEDSSFDYVDLGVAWGFFIDDRSQGLKECRRVVKPNGRVFCNNLFYVEMPPPDLFKEVERIVGLDLSLKKKFDYNFFYDLMSNDFELESELIIEYDGMFSQVEYEDNIRKHIKRTDASISKLSEEEQEIFVREYGKARSILRMNEDYCLSALQAWKPK
jgi:ubiquinone/menaquinone biosynthesis C-methylase UbiE